MKETLNPDGKKQLHKIFHLSRWRDIDWMQVYINRKKWKANSYQIREIFIGPIRKILNLFNSINIWLITLATVLKFQLNISWKYYVYAVPALFVLFMVDEIIDKIIGFHPLTLLFHNKEKQIDREKNDTEMAKMIRKVDRLYYLLASWSDVSYKHIDKYGICPDCGEQKESLVMADHLKCKCPICQEIQSGETLFYRCGCSEMVLTSSVLILKDHEDN